MTLLRLNGIPTRWQSGMVFSDGDYSNIHDWGYLYLAPYGWVPMDVTTGRLHPGAGDDKALEWFYLGGLDNYRIAFNSDYGQPFQPPKQHFRSGQRGFAARRGRMARRQPVFRSDRLRLQVADPAQRRRDAAANNQGFSTRLH